MTTTTRKTSHFFNLQDTLFKYFLIACSVLVVALLIAIFYFLYQDALPAISYNGWNILTGMTWNTNLGVFGALPVILGTLATGGIATLIAIPLSLAIAIFYTEYTPHRFRLPLRVFIDLLAAVPSIVYGFWALQVLLPIAKINVMLPLVTYLGFIPIFSGPAEGASIFLAIIILTIMVIPIITAISIEILAKTPIALKEGMTSLGATKWETVRHVGLPFARLGIFAGVILGLGRALGETMAVTLIIGNTFNWPFHSVSLFSTGDTVTSWITNEFPEAVGLDAASLFELALILLIITLAVNLIARTIINRVSKGRFS